MSAQTEVLKFLAQWLLENNPNKPRVLLPEAARVEAEASATAARERQAQLRSAAVAAGGDRPAQGALESIAPAALALDAQGSGKQRTQQQEAAATRIQAAFKGHQARRLVAGRMRVEAEQEAGA
jgi:hypothetical protein